MQSRGPRTGHLLTCAVAALALCAPAWGTVVNYTVDPAQSALTLSNAWLGMTMLGSSAESLITTYQGSIQADVTDSTIQLTNANLNADVSGSYRPAAGGGRGDEAADYAGFYSLGCFGIFGNVEVAFRDVLLNLASGPLALNGGAFDAAGATVTAAGGSMDHVGGGLLGWLAGRGRSPLTGSGVSNDVATAGSVTQNGSLETLTIPVDATFSVKIESPFLADCHEWFEVNLNGTIVATRAAGEGAERPIPDIPEPATLVLAVLGLCMVGFRRR